MTTAPIEARRQYWLNNFALDNFEIVEEGCDKLLDLPVSIQHPVHWPAFVGLVVLYSAPWSTSFGAGRLSEDIIPTELLSIHRVIIEFRNQSFAHLSRLKKEHQSSPPANHTIVYFCSGKVADRRVSRLDPSTFPLQETKDLAGRLCATLRERIDSFESTYAPNPAPSDGWYSINAADSPDDILFPYGKSG